MADPVGPDRPVTADNLKSDCASVAQQLHDLWDGEVEVVIALIPKIQLNPDVAWATTVNRRSRLLAILDKIRDRSIVTADLKAKE